MRVHARASSVVLSLMCALWACGNRANVTPPIYAPLPAPDVDQEAAPAHGRLPADTHPLAYSLRLELDPKQTSYRGSVAIELQLDRPRESLWLHSRGPRVRAARVARGDADSLPAQLESVGDSGLAALRFRQPVGPGAVRLELEFDADFGQRLTGLYRVESGGDAYAFTQFEPTSAREAFPCFDEPRFKTPFELSVVAPAGLTVVANTRQTSESALADGRVERRFARTEKLPTYLVALAAGPLDLVSAPALAASEERARTLPLGGVAVKGRGPDLAYALRETPKLLLPLERYFGVEYPYDKLDLIAVPDFGAGAMENAGAITFRDTLLLIREDASEGQLRRFAYVNAHELAHQWFGNLVTMPWWDDVWLNESFATWMGTRVVEEAYPEYKAKLGELTSTQGAMEVDSQAAARQIRQPIESDHDIENAFDAITYAKGGAVLSMFERFLGPEAFRAGLRLYMARHRFGSATAQDLVAALAEAAQKPEVGPAFFSFLEQPGVPLIEARVSCASGVSELSLTQSRYAPVGSALAQGSVWQIPVCVRFGQARGAEPAEQCTLLRERTTSVRLASEACPDWLLPNSQAAGYYRWALEPHALDALVSAHQTLAEAEQISLVHNLFAGLRSAKLGADRAFAAAEQLSAIPSRVVLEQVLGMFGFAREHLLRPEQLPSYRASIARIVKPRYAALGLSPKAGQSPNGEEKLLRSSLVRALAFEAKDPALLRELAALGRAQLAHSAASARPARTSPALARLPPELIDAAFSAALREGGAALLTQAADKLFAENEGIARARLLSAISTLDRPELSEQVLNLSLDARLRTNERLGPLFGQAGREETRAAAYAWVKRNYDAFVAVLSEHQSSALIGVGAGFCSEDMTRDVEAFFAPRAPKLAGGPRDLAMTLESIRLCAALEQAQGEKARAFFTTTGERAARAGTAKPARR
jgi:cytosol alanyl aminopeptidase